MATMSDQQRDNWSRETVRALRKKVKNLQHQIDVRNWAIQARKHRTLDWRNRYYQTEQARRDTAVELDRTTQALQRALANNETLKAALAYYAAPANYVDQDTSCGDPACCGGPWPSVAVVDQDGGDRARAALGIETCTP